ncbi:MAG: hypothetical protein IJO36_03705 [Clostridia bacterium]|nr:hypothetical protein [Clostridia bacterium]
MKNYFDHEIKVKYIDGILSKNTDWIWYIKYVQENFEPDFSVHSNYDFLCKFSHIKDLFEHLNKIHELVASLEIDVDWLKNIDMVSQFYVGIINFDSLILSNDFIRLLTLYALCAKLVNETSETKYVIYMEMFRTYNIFEIIETSNFSDELEKIDCILDQLQIDFSLEKSIFSDNLNHNFHRCEDPSEQLLEMCNNANAFSFSNTFDRKNIAVWEERYILELLSSEYKNGKLTPCITYRDGSTHPDFTAYTPQLMQKIKNYYTATDVEFLVESIEYALFDIKPSDNTISKHFKLWKDNVDNFDETKQFSYLMCSSLEFMIAFWRDPKIDLNNQKPDLYKTLSAINHIQYLSYLNNNNFPLPKLAKNILKDYKKNKAQAVDNIDDIHNFLTYVTDADIISIVDKEIFYKVSDKFEYVIENVASDGIILISSAFLDYLLFLIKIKNNRNVISHEVSTEIIYIRSLWQSIYFEKCFKSMKLFNNSINISADELEKFNSEIISKPLSYAYDCLRFKKTSLIETLSFLAENPLAFMVHNIAISKDFPYERKIHIDESHPIDMIIKDVVEKTHEANQHKFLNSLSVEENLSGIYKIIEDKVHAYFRLFGNTKQLYEITCKNNPQYRFIEHSDKPSLAHLTQLFPILENKIREVGEFYGISPICEKEDKYHKLKEPSSVLNKIIKMIYDETEEISYASDFIFIHFTMFAENGFNIRNECVHGNNYATKDSDIIFAFKVSLFCLHLLDYRLDLMFHRKH